MNTDQEQPILILLNDQIVPFVMDYNVEEGWVDVVDQKASDEILSSQKELVESRKPTEEEIKKLYGPSRHIETTIDTQWEELPVKRLTGVVHLITRSSIT